MRSTRSRQACHPGKALWIKACPGLSTEKRLYIHHNQNDLLKICLVVMVVSSAKAAFRQPQRHAQPDRSATTGKPTQVEERPERRPVDEWKWPLVGN
jgi:hypothetical protein